MAPKRKPGTDEEEAAVQYESHVATVKGDVSHMTNLGPMEWKLKATGYGFDNWALVNEHGMKNQFRLYGFVGMGSDLRKNVKWISM
jgi:hypothetical protein